MDRIIERKKGIRKKHIPYIAGGAAFIALILWIFLGNHEASLRIDSRTIVTAAAEKGMFNDFIKINGQVQPITTVQLTPLEGGVVEEIAIEEGAMLKKGDIIVRLSNSQLNLQILESEASLAEKENFLRNTQVTMEQEKLTLERERVQLNMDVERKGRKYMQYKRLYEEELIAREDMIQAAEDYQMAVKDRKLIIARQKQDSLYRKIQIEELENSLRSMNRNMELIHERMDNLNVKSPIDGQLGSLDVMLGQSLSSGSNIGQVNDLSDYKIEALIDEHYIDRVRTGLSATFERQGGTFPLEVKKVYPDVKEGQFKTDLVFTGERPDNIRTGQTYYINLELGQPTEAVIIPRGAFYQSTGGMWIFVLTPEGDKAYRREIRIGRQNPQYYEVIEGLAPGEQVIISGYDNYGDNEILILN